jgi:hypothetical protein
MIFLCLIGEASRITNLNKVAAENKININSGHSFFDCNLH